jgi:hypothetical protein
LQYLHIYQQAYRTDPEVPGSIPGSSRFSEKQRVWNGVLVKTTEELLGRKSSGSGLENRD